MNTILLLLSLLILGPVARCLAQNEPAAVPAPPDSTFEELPELKASEILKPEVFQGPHHTVRESVPTSSGMNQFVIDSDFGVFDADGNEMLLCRVKEVYAIAQLKDVSRTDQFKQSLATAAKSKLTAAENIVKDPGQAISNVPKGVMKFMGRAGETIKHVSKGETEKDTDGNKIEKAIGYSNAKRQIAVSMGIDPYSTNSVLQKELDGVAKASWAGGFVFDAGTFPISGPVGAALTVTSVSTSLDKLVQEKPPADLKAINRNALRAMGAGEKDTERFLGNRAFSPTQQTAFVLNLKSLGGVANRAAFVHAAAKESSNESDALFCVQTSALMGQLHSDDHPLARIAMIENLPVCIAKDGTVTVALQWDYAAWTPAAAEFTGELQKLAAQGGEAKPLLIVISGQMSPRLQQELQSRGFTVRDRANSGPLR